MLIKVDAKALEWRVACDYFNETVGLEEIRHKVDQHSLNQSTLGLPSRLIAKIFLFRLIFGGTEFAYAGDPEFSHVSSDPSFWKEIIDRTYRKYYGLAEGHKEIVRLAMKNHIIRIPTGREYYFEPYMNKRGEMQWPRTNILNYPVQGFAAEIMSIARVSAKKRLSKYYPNILFINTVHDDIQLDIKEKYLDNVIEIMYNVFSDLPRNIMNVYNYEFKCPLECEIYYGPNLSSLREVVHAN